MAVQIEPHAEPIPGYKLLDRIGAGGFGEVWRAEAPGGIFKAIKVIHGDLRSQDNDLVRYAEQELKSLKRVKQVRHPYLLALDRYDIIEGRLLITMELADCNLWDRFRECRAKGMIGIPRDELLLYLAETAEVLDLFNDQFQLQHLDIKPQNLFLLANHVKVADFGQVKDLEGLVGPVTGGITPVYAAPETFDGIITRNCDQYSLACVYQELLTGARPFDGTSLSQLLTQHVNLPPNLSPSPACDRPALSRALAKKAEDRWPSVKTFVYGLLNGSVSGRISFPTPRSTPDIVVDAMPSTPPVAAQPAQPSSVAHDTPLGRGVTEGPLFTPAPPESTGPGPLRPALVIGLGQTGLRVLRRLHYDLAERFGQPEMLAIVQSLYVDTDPEDLGSAEKADPARRYSALRGDEIFAAKLQRASHYLKPRFSGRTLTEGWLDPSMLYRIPRNLQTGGVRMFGRLAFCDHYRPLMGKIHTAIDTMVAADAMTQTEGWTGLLRRTNRPRVYVVAGLGGGTGSGMFIDMAYAVRNRLKRMGYDSPDVVGVLVAPPADSEATSQQAIANTYAALTELNHYSRPDTMFVANYDERLGLIEEKSPPFSRVFVLPGVAHPGAAASGAARPATRTPPTILPPSARGMVATGSRVIANPGSRVIAKPGSRTIPAHATQREMGDVDSAASRRALKPFADAAELIRVNLFEPLGRAIDERRAAAEEAPTGGLSAFGIAGYHWPRAEVVARTSAKVARTMLRRWSSSNTKRTREVIPGLAQKQWTQLGLDPGTVQAQLQLAADRAAGGDVDSKIAAIVEPLVPRGWLARLPEPERVSVALDKIAKLVGVPGGGTRRAAGLGEKAIGAAAIELAGGSGLDVHAAVPGLVDDPHLRLAGSEEMIRQFHATSERLVESHLLAADEQEAKARTAYDYLCQYAHFQKGTRKPTANELTEALKRYPKMQYQAQLSRSLGGVYHALRKVLAEQLAAVSAARQRLEAASPSNPTVDAAFAERPAGSRQLMPPGCNSVGQAIEWFLGTLTDADLNEIDHRIQLWIEPKYGTVFQACLNSTTGPDDVLRAIYEETRLHLDGKLGAHDFAAMFSERHHTPQAAERALAEVFREAEPAWVGPGPWTAHEVTVAGCPAGKEGEVLRELTRRAIPVAGLPFAECPDAMTIYREWPGVPITALPHAGAMGTTAFREAADAQQCSPHARVDIEMWTEIDAP
jgi:hypothetical protein